MNKFAIALHVVAVLAVIGGIISGITLYQTPSPGYEYLTDKNYGVLFTWIIAGVISGVVISAFAEIINLLTKKKELIGDQLALLRDVKYELKQRGE